MIYEQSILIKHTKLITNYISVVKRSFRHWFIWAAIEIPNLEGRLIVASPSQSMTKQPWKGRGQDTTLCDLDGHFYYQKLF